MTRHQGGSWLLRANRWALPVVNRIPRSGRTKLPVARRGGAELGEGNTPSPGSNANEISVEALNGAKAILDFVIPSTKLLLENEIGESQHQRKQRRILEHLKKKEGIIDWRKLQQSKILGGGVAEYKYVVESMESVWANPDYNGWETNQGDPTGKH